MFCVAVIYLFYSRIWIAEDHTYLTGAGKTGPDFTSQDNRIEVVLFFPSKRGDRLFPERREIFDTRTNASKAKQVINELIAGPGDERLFSVLSPGVNIRNLYLSSDGTAYVDFSAEFIRDCPSGTTGELHTVYSVVNALTYNFFMISRVKILVEGHELLTLKGHLDLRKAFSGNMSLVEWQNDAGMATPVDKHENEDEP